jgi:hypothetical protein
MGTDATLPSPGAVPDETPNDVPDRNTSPEARRS